MIILPWGSFCYNHLPMVIDNSPDILQHNMNDLSHVLEFICAYIDDILVLTKAYGTDHVWKLGLTRNKMKGKRFKCNIGKSFFEKNEMEYLGFWVTSYGVKSINRSIEAIPNMKTHTSQE